MIRSFKDADLDDVMQIWLNSNIDAHFFVDEDYGKSNFNSVSQMISEAEVYVYETGKGIIGFIGVVDSYIAGLFVKKDFRSQKIGKQLLDYVKTLNKSLLLDVYAENSLAIKFYKREGFQIIDKHINEETNQLEYTMQY